MHLKRRPRKKMDGSGDNGRDRFVAALDIGTTTIRCIIFDQNLQIRGSANDQVELLYPVPGFVEIDPDIFWTKITNTIRNSIQNAKLSPEQIDCLGISTLRSTFITWDKVTGEPYHNFITWKDLRADEMVKRWNASYLLKSFNFVTQCLFYVTRVKRFLAGSVLKFMNTQVTLRLTWMIQNNEKIKAGLAKKTALFGTVDSWLLYKLRPQSQAKHHVTDITNATATGFFDPFIRDWASYTFSVCGIRKEMLPEVVANDHDFGSVDPTLFGHPIPIRAVMGDQPAAMWGSCCFEKGDLKVTLGTGSFLDLNTGTHCHASIHGLYPLVAWQVGKSTNKNTMYAMEGGSSDTGSIIKWAQNFGLFEDAKYSSEIACSVPDSEEVFFIPAFSGLGNITFFQPPINDHQAATGILGLRPHTKTAHIVRAVLESIAFRVVQLYDCTKKETEFKFTLIRVDGGVSQNDFICQLIADLTGLKVERGSNSDASAIGIGFVAGLSAGIWKDKSDMVKMRKVDKTFIPNSKAHEKCVKKMAAWERALERFKDWYNPEDLHELVHKE